MIGSVVTEVEEATRDGAASLGRAAPRRAWGPVVRDVLPFLAIVILVVYFSLASDVFLSGRNLTLMTGQAGILLLAALGATLVIVAGSIDLSVGSVVLLTGAIVAHFANDVTSSAVAVIAVSLGIGAAIGAFNGLIFAYGRVPSFITTLGTLSLLAGVSLLILNGQSIQIRDFGFMDLAVGKVIPGVQNAGLIGGIALTLVWLLSRRTRFGLYVYAIGGNERVAELSGIRTNRVKLLVFVLSGATAALAGVLMAAQLGSSGPTLGSTTMLDSIAAIVVGGTALSGGVGGVHRTLLGVLILTVLSNGLNQVGAEDYTQTIIKGAVVVVAAVFTMASQRKLIVK